MTRKTEKACNYQAAAGMMVRSQYSEPPIKEKTMARRARTATAAPAPEPEVAETPEEGATNQKRGPGKLAETHLAWIDTNYGQVDRLELLYLAQTTRREFRESPEYEAYLDAEDERKEQAAKDKEKRAKEREEAAKAAPAEAPAEEAPKPARRGRAAKAAPAAAEEAPAEAPAKPTRRRAAKAAPAAEPTVEADSAPATTPARRSRKPAPF